MKPTGREPDPSFDRFLAHGLARTVDASGSACPDADLLAAWFDHTLSAVEGERIEAHVSGCECCQQILAALARSEPEVIRAAPLPAPARAWHWHWRWVVPLATAVLVVVVGTKTLISPSPPAVVGTPPPQQAKASAPAEARAPEANLAAAKSEVPPPPVQAAAAPAAAPTAGAPARAAKPERQMAEMAARQADTAGGQAVTSVQAPMPAPPPPPPALMKAGEPKAVPTADAESLARVARPTITAVGARPAALTASVVAGPTAAWRFGRDGSIEKSSDHGQTWQSQSSGVTTALADASAPSDTVCWIVGAQGVVLRTADGRTWQRLASPTGADLVAVHAWSDLAATVTAADHAVYETSDGGKTWRRR